MPSSWNVKPAVFSFNILYSIQHFHIGILKYSAKITNYKISLKCWFLLNTHHIPSKTDWDTICVFLLFDLWEFESITEYFAFSIILQVSAELHHAGLQVQTLVKPPHIPSPTLSCLIPYRNSFTCFQCFVTGQQRASVLTLLTSMLNVICTWRCYDPVTSPLFSSLCVSSVCMPSSDLQKILVGMVKSYAFNLACFHLDLTLTARYGNQHFRCLDVFFFFLDRLVCKSVYFCVLSVQVGIELLALNKYCINLSLSVSMHIPV